MWVSNVSFGEGSVKVQGALIALCVEPGSSKVQVGFIRSNWCRDLGIRDL